MLITSLARMNPIVVSPVTVAAREVDGTTFLFVSACECRGWSSGWGGEGGGL